MVTKLVTETGLAGKPSEATISSDMGSAMAHLQQSGLAKHRGLQDVLGGV